MKNQIYKPGDKVGKLTLIKQVVREWPSGHKYVKWECLCECGETKELVTQTLHTSQARCTHIDQWRKWNFKGHEELPMAYWNSIKVHAERRNIGFNLTIKQGWDLFINQNKTCALTNIPLTFKPDKRKKGQIGIIHGSASLDRIDSNQGYTIDNVQWVHKDINRMKNTFTSERFAELCRLVTETGIKVGRE